LTPPAAVGIIREITVFNPTQSGLTGLDFLYQGI
jgi:hypothetical protein